jgi:hypothetical protein
MIGHIVEKNNDRRIVLLKAGPAYLQQKVSDTPVLVNNIIDQISTSEGPMYLGPDMCFGLIEQNTIAIAEDPERLTLSLLADLNKVLFIQQIIQTWSRGAAPSWATDCTDDLLAYLRWMTGEVDSLSRSAPIPH